MAAQKPLTREIEQGLACGQLLGGLWGLTALDTGQRKKKVSRRDRATTRLQFTSTRLKMAPDKKGSKRKGMQNIYYIFILVVKILTLF